jgi:hypothetical protein
MTALLGGYDITFSESSPMTDFTGRDVLVADRRGNTCR